MTSTKVAPQRTGARARWPGAGASFTRTGANLGKAALGALEVVTRRSEVFAAPGADRRAPITRRSPGWVRRRSKPRCCGLGSAEVAAKAQRFLARRWWRESTLARAPPSASAVETPAGRSGPGGRAAGTLERSRAWRRRWPR